MPNLSPKLRKLNREYANLTILLVVLMFLSLAVGCSSRRSVSVTTPANKNIHSQGIYPIAVTDDRGKSISIKSESRRIVSISPSNTEILYALGLGDRIVGVTNFCDYPPEAKEKPKIGDMNVSVEKVLSLQPDLILAHGKLNDGIIRQLEGLNLTVVALDPESIIGVKRDILLVGRVCGQESVAKQLDSRIAKAIEQVTLRNKGKAGARTLVAIQANPLWVAGPKTLVGEMLSICNAENIAADARPGFNTFPIERALARDPQVIVVGRESERKFLIKSPVWKNTTAVRSDRVVVINPDLLVRPGPRLVEGLQLLEKAVHRVD